MKAEIARDQEAAKKKEAARIASYHGKLQLDKISQGELTSLVGTWKNADGDSYDIINKVVQNPKQQPGSPLNEGLEIKNKVSHGWPQVITKGEMVDDFMSGSIGTFNPAIKNSAFTVVAIVPAGFKMGEQDQSNIKHDRLILGATYNDLATNVYYRQ